MSELKPCPFCGGVAYILQAGTRSHSCIVECESCGVRLETGEEGSACGNAWNRRAGYVTLIDELERLREANRLLHEQLDTARETIGRMRAAGTAPVPTEARKYVYRDIDYWLIEISGERPIGHVIAEMTHMDVARQAWSAAREGIATAPTKPAEGRELPPLPTPYEINWPELHSSALGCGVEDRNIRDRYEAAEYGWQDGVDKAVERVPEEIFTADQMREYARSALATAPTSEAVQGAIDAARAVIREELDAVSTHPCDYRDDEIRSRTLSAHHQKLYRALAEIDRAAAKDKK